MPGSKILGFGRAVPRTVITNKDLEKLFDTSDEWITKRTGIKERRVIDPDKGETAVSLGVEAAQSAIANASKNGQEITAQDIDLVICATATGDYLFPATSCLIQEELKIENAAAFDIAAACTGFVYALNLAHNFVKCGQYKNIMVIAVDLMSRYIDWSDRSTACIFGDGAGAAIVSAAEQDHFGHFYLRASGDAKCMLNVPNVGSNYPVAAKDITQKPIMVHMEGQAVYQFAVKAMPEALEVACRESGIKPEELDYVVPHQANQRIVEGASKRLNISLDKFICNIDRYGNTSAASIPIAFHEALEEGKIPAPGQGLKIAMVGFGAGLTWGATVLEW